MLMARNRILRREPELTQFETAQIANLCPADAEEAKSIIPRCAFKVVVRQLSLIFSRSLVKIEDDRLQALLDEIQAMRKFQT
jgi:DNA-directed RNA polymerase II subunit RPB4